MWRQANTAGACFPEVGAGGDGRSSFLSWPCGGFLMKTCMAIVGFLAFGASLTPLEDTEAIFKDTVKLMNEMTDVLKPVKDKAGAERALPKLKLINERLAGLRKKELATPKGPPEEN